MDKIEIQNMTNQLETKSRDLVLKILSLHTETLLFPASKQANLPKSTEIANEVFDAVINNKIPHGSQNINIGRAVGLIGISFSHRTIDADFLKRMISLYVFKPHQHLILKSFNVSKMDILRIFITGLINLDIEKYTYDGTAQRELNQLLNNLYKILDDTYCINSDRTIDPLDNLETYITKHKPSIYYIEGIDCQNYEKYSEMFKLIGKLGEVSDTSRMIRFEISFVNLPLINSDETIENIISYFRS